MQCRRPSLLRLNSRQRLYVYRLYKGALGRQPTYQQFITDRARVVGGSNLAADKVALANDFVTRDEFLARYPATDQ